MAHFRGHEISVNAIICDLTDTGVIFEPHPDGKTDRWAVAVVPNAFVAIRIRRTFRRSDVFNLLEYLRNWHDGAEDAETIADAIRRVMTRRYKYVNTTLYA